MIKKPVRIESNSVYLKIVDDDDVLLCFISNERMNHREIADEIVAAINNQNEQEK